MNAYYASLGRYSRCAPLLPVRFTIGACIYLSLIGTAAT